MRIYIQLEKKNWPISQCKKQKIKGKKLVW